MFIGKRFALSMHEPLPLPFMGEGWGEGGSGDSELPDRPSPPPLSRKRERGRQARSPDAIRGCPAPFFPDCIRATGIGSCGEAMFRAVQIIANPPCVRRGASLEWRPLP